MALPKTCILSRQKEMGAISLRWLPSNYGFSLIEILMVTALLMVLSGLALVVNLDAYKSYSFKSEQTLLVGLLQKARSQSINNMNQQPHGVYINQMDDSYTLFEGANYNSRNANSDIVFAGNGGCQISGATEVVFDQLSGDTLNTGNIILDDRIHSLVNIEINNEGRINLY